MRLKHVFFFSCLICVCTSSELSRGILDSKERQRMLTVAKTIMTSYDILNYKWESFKTKYNKFYSPDEDFDRLKIFAENMKLIAEHNDLYQKGVVTYSVEMNKFGDQTHEERMRLLGFRPDFNVRNRNRHTVYNLPLRINVPFEKDWRKDGAVTKVKNQGNCGSCWAFSATGAIEGQYFLETKKLLELSEQNLVDCSYSVGNAGCDGGLPELAFDYIEENGGIDTESSYPYEGYDSNVCQYEPKYAGATTDGYSKIPEDEESLRNAVFASGPISVSFDAAGFGFHFYKRGIYYNHTCNWEYKTLNHAALIVGFGNITNVGNYWMVKNSWGEDWGDHGYIRMARDRHNNCGIATNAILPRIKTQYFGEH